ncbi:MAG: phage tail tape measure protein, partial [Methyloprofundus sp.]|nr:phage tail tape measure protein [Methyloprofundus sp.]
MTMIVRELITRLGFTTDTKAVKSYDGAMKDLGKSIAVVTGAAAAAGAALFGFMRAEAGAADQSAKLGRQLGLTATEVEALQFAEGQTGAEGFTASLGNLQSRLAEAARGTGRAKQALEDYGIQALDANGKSRSLIDVLPEIADQMQAMTEGEQADLARQLGLSPQALLLMREGSAGLSDLTRRFEELGGGIDQADAAAAEEFNDTLAEMGVVISSIRRAVAVQFLPVAKELAETIRDWFIANREIVKQRMSRAIDVVSSALRVFWGFATQVMRVVDGLAQTMGGWANTLKIVGIALGVAFGVKAVMAVFSMVAAVKALTVAMWANPVGLIVLAV